MHSVGGWHVTVLIVMPAYLALERSWVRMRHQLVPYRERVTRELPKQPVGGVQWRLLRGRECLKRALAPVLRV